MWILSFILVFYMLIRKFFLLVLLLSSITGFSQVAFQNLSLSDALSQAKAEGKLIFLQLESPDCKECNETGLKGLSDKELGQRVNAAFIPLYVQAKHKDRLEIENLFNSPDGFGTLFIDHNANLIHKYGGSASIAKKYTEQIDIAFNKAGESIKLSELEKLYNNGNKSVGLLEQIMLKKKELNLDNTGYLSEYVSIIPADSLSSTHTLRFIASFGPILGSKADSVLRKDRKLFNEAWYSMAITARASINARIIYSSLNKAVREKDEAYAFRIASFAKATVTSTKEAQEKAFNMRLLEFYSRTNNHTAYLSTAIDYYDRFLMTVNADSIKKLDETRRTDLASTATKDTIKTETGFTVRSTVRFAPVGQRYTNELKEGARNVYKRTTDPALLAKATIWIKRGLEFYNSYDALEVYALLLYKQQQKEEAIAVEKQAIELKKKMKYSVTDNEEILQKMEKGVAID